MFTPISRAVALTGLALLTAIPAQAQPTRHDHNQRHVLLISVDGLHASDVWQFAASDPDSTFARLQRGGTTFSEASASQPSDSFPGLLAMVTGGTPKTTGVFYDDSYARDMWAAGSNCTEPPGAEMMYFENLDVTDPITGNIPRFTQIDKNKLPKGMVNGHCVPVYPHSFLQTNTIFNIAHAADMYTAWSDKTPGLRHREWTVRPGRARSLYPRDQHDCR